MQLSYWEYQEFIEGNYAVVIGRGIVGINAAIHLAQQSQRKVLVVDRAATPQRASSKNAGFACFGSVSEILEDIDVLGAVKAQQLLRLRYEGLQAMRRLVDEERIAYQDCGAKEIFQDENLAQKCIGQIDQINQLISPIVEDDACYRLQQGPFGPEILNKKEGALNPQLLMNELEKVAASLGVKFLNGVEVQSIEHDQQQLSTSIGKIPFERLVIATNGFSQSIPQLSHLVVMPARNQVFVTQELTAKPFEGCYHLDAGYVYFRMIGNRVLIGGGRNMDFDVENTTAFGTTKKIKSYLLEIIRRLLQDSSVTFEYSYAGILGVGEDKFPIIEKLSENIVCAIKMGGMGVAIGTLVGRQAAETISSKA